MPDTNNAIALNAWPNGGATSISPLAQVDEFAQVQNRFNENKLFQQTFHARQQAGKIIANAKDLETGLNDLTKDPDVAPFAGAIINDYRQAMLAVTQFQGEQQKQAQSGLEAIVKSFPAILENPKSYDSIINLNMSALSPSAQQRLKPAFEALKQSLVDGLPADPKAAMQTLGQRLAGVAVAGGLSDKGVFALLGTPTTIDQGGVKTPGLVLPPQGSPYTPGAGGSFQPAGASLGMSLAPQVTSGPGQVPIIVGGGAGGGGGGGNALGGGTVSGPSAGGSSLGQVAPPAAAGAPRSSSASGAASPAPAGIAGDGKPLIPAGTSMQAPYEGTGVAGLRILSAPQQAQADELNKQFNDEELKQFQGAQAAKGTLVYMNNAYDKLVQGGGFLIPGTAAELRGNFAKLVNTVSSILGPDIVKELPFAPDKIGSIEEFNKDTRRMGAQVTNLFFGAGREAAQTIQSMTSSVPSVDNTYLGGKLLTAGIGAMLQRAVDERNFKLKWANDNQGNLAGAAEKFNELHPAEGYAEGVLDSMGMTADGFKAPEDVGKAVRHGLLTPEQGKKILQDQFKFK